MIDFVDFFKTFILGCLVGHAIEKWRIDRRRFKVLQNRLERLEAWQRLVERAVKKDNH